MSDKTGGPAFPAHEDATDGMSLRDWFAGMVLQGSLSSEAGEIGLPKLVAKVAYEYADAMLKEREKSSKNSG